jgi:hypothetical protein
MKVILGCLALLALFFLGIIALVYFVDVACGHPWTAFGVATVLLFIAGRDGKPKVNPANASPKSA